MITSIASYTLGQSVIDLGSHGKLIEPVQVDGGKWYYFWDRSGDGTSLSRGSLNGGKDTVSHIILDRLLSFDIKGIPSPFKTTDNDFRFGKINGVNVALPTYGANANESGVFAVGTNIGSSTGDTSLNGKYDGLLAIWDAYNGSSSGSRYVDGTPPGWQKEEYWSATPAGTGYIKVDLSDGSFLTSNYPSSDQFVVLEVLPQSVVNDKKETNKLNVLVNRGILEVNSVILKDLIENIVVVNGVVSSHTVTYGSTEFNYRDIDSLITTVTRNNAFTDEFKTEIADLVPSLSGISYDSIVSLVGVTNIDAVIRYIAGADGNLVG